MKGVIPMGYFLFILLLLFELIVTVRSFQTKEPQQKLKHSLHLTAFILFSVLCITKVLEWGFRYYLLGLVLLIQAIIAVIRITTGHYRNKTYRPVKMILKEVLVIITIFFLVLPSIIFPQYKEPEATGTYEVTTATYTYTDPNRLDPYADDGSNRFVNVEFWYPEDANESCPLILFSHGTYGLRISNESTYRNLASNGYIVCAFDHPHHSFYTKSTDGTVTLVDTSVIQLINDTNLGVYDAKTQIKLMRELTMIRVDDFSFALDKILDLANTESSDELYHMIDSSKIGVFGHSLGGAAAIELGRERSDISAVINLDGDMSCEYLDYVDNALVINEEPYPCPLLNIWSTNMTELMEKNLDSDTFPEEYIASTAPVEFDITVEGTNHFSFTDLSLFSPFLCKLFLGMSGVDSNTSVSARETVEEMNETILEFFDCYLKGNGEFQPTNEYSFQ